MPSVRWLATVALCAASLVLLLTRLNLADRQAAGATELETNGCAMPFGAQRTDAATLDALVRPVTAVEARQAVAQSDGAGRVHGVVRDPTGAPAPDVQVYVWGELARDDFIANTGSDARGEFEITGLSLPGAYYLTAWKHNGCISARDIWLHTRTAPFELSAARSTSYVELELDGPDTSLAVDVVDESGRPLQGASVALYVRDPRDRLPVVRNYGWSSAAETTDALGQCRFERESGGSFEVIVGLAGWISHPQFASVATDGHAAVVVRMRRGATLAGVVLDADGAPLAETWLELRGVVSCLARTDAQGRFRCNELAPGAVWLRVTAEHVCEQRTLSPRYVVGPFEAGAEDLRIRLPPPARMSFSLDPPPASREVDGELLFEHDRMSWDARCDDSGRVELCFAVPAGPTRIAIEAGDWPMVALGPLDIAPGAVLDLGTLCRQHGVPLTGVVRGSDGAPIAGAEVTLDFELGSRLWDATTDERGRYSFDDLPASVVGSIEVASPGCLDESVDFLDLAALRTLDFQLRRYPKLRIRVQGATRPLIGSPTVCAVLYRAGEPLYVESCTSARASDGAFELEVAPGRYKLALCPFGGDEQLVGPDVTVSHADIELEWQL